MPTLTTLISFGTKSRQDLGNQRKYLIIIPCKFTRGCSSLIIYGHEKKWKIEPKKVDVQLYHLVASYEKNDV